MQFSAGKAYQERSPSKPGLVLRLHLRASWICLLSSSSKKIPPTRAKDNFCYASPSFSFSRSSSLKRVHTYFEFPYKRCYLDWACYRFGTPYQDGVNPAGYVDLLKIWKWIKILVAMFCKQIQMQSQNTILKQCNTKQGMKWKCYLKTVTLDIQPCFHHSNSLSVHW